MSSARSRGAATPQRPGGCSTPPGGLAPGSSVASTTATTPRSARPSSGATKGRSGRSCSSAHGTGSPAARATTESGGRAAGGAAAGRRENRGAPRRPPPRWFLGEFSECFAFLSSSYWEIGPLEDNAFALLRTAGGQVASLHASWTEWKNLFSFEVFGREGYVKVEGLNGSYGTERAVLGKRSPSAPFRERVLEFRGEDRSWAEEGSEFVEAVDEGREPLGSGTDGLMASRLTQALYESARTGRAVTPGGLV